MSSPGEPCRYSADETPVARVYLLRLVWTGFRTPTVHSGIPSMPQDTHVCCFQGGRNACDVIMMSVRDATVFFQRGCERWVCPLGQSLSYILVVTQLYWFCLIRFDSLLMDVCSGFIWACELRPRHHPLCDELMTAGSLVDVTHLRPGSVWVQQSPGSEQRTLSDVGCCKRREMKQLQPPVPGRRGRSGPSPAGCRRVFGTDVP